MANSIPSQYHMHRTSRNVRWSFDVSVSTHLLGKGDPVRTPLSVPQRSKPTSHWIFCLT